MLSNSYDYAKERRRFGRECLFGEQHKILDTRLPEPKQAALFIRKDPVDGATQLSKQMAHSEANTENAVLRSSGMRHWEGGWPREVNMLDEEATLRYRKKIERDDQWAAQLQKILKPMMHNTLQNNTVQLYEKFFDDAEPVAPIERPAARTTQCFRNPVREQQLNAGAAHLSFSPDGNEMAIAYARTAYQAAQLQDCSSFIWALDNPNRPLQQLECGAAALTIEYNFRDGKLLAGGLINGQVCVWDSRAGGAPQMLSAQEVSHRTRVNSLLWMHAKCNCTFYSGSADGQIYWWDSRNLKAPVEQMRCDPVRGDRQELAQAFGVSVLEFDYTMPNKYLVGTEEGAVFFGNRKGTVPADFLYGRMQCHHGPVRALERNPMFVKYFATCGEHRIKMWTEECRDASIIWMCSPGAEQTAGAWSRTRCSVWTTGRADGFLDFWDVLASRRRPVVTMKVSTTGSQVEHIKAHENGALFAVGDANGDAYLVEVSDALKYMSKMDKALLSAMFERETKREKLLEARMRELKLKEKQLQEEMEKELAKLDKKERRRKEAEQAAAGGGSKKGSKTGTPKGSKPSTPKPSTPAESDAGEDGEKTKESIRSLTSEEQLELERAQVLNEFMESVVGEQKRRDSKMDCA